MHIAELTLHNWGPYQGTHTINLEPTVYAVVAMHSDDPDRSNWIGKSWFLGGLLFALTGQKPDSCDSEDDWITRGESAGSVTLTLSDGARIHRSRKLGRSSQLSFALADQLPAKQKTAQELIDTHIGMRLEDLRASSFIEQKQTARLILADPGERTKIVNTWLELKPVQQAEGWLRDRLNELLKRDRAMGVIGEAPDVDIDLVNAELDRLNKTVTYLLEKRQQHSDTLAAQDEWKAHAHKAQRFDELRTQGKELRATVDAFAQPDVDESLSAYNGAVTAWSQASERHEQLADLVGDQSWSGECPVTCSDCPVADDVRRTGETMQRELAEAQANVELTADAKDDAFTEHDKRQRLCAQQQQRVAHLDRIRADATALLPSREYIDQYGAPPDSSEVLALLTKTNADINAMQLREAELQQQVRDYTRYESRVEKMRSERERLSSEIRTHHEALAIIGRNGAQREIAEGALAIIERNANQLLTQASVDLSLSVEWSRAGKGLAKHCDQCGVPFPTSQRAKTCDNCSAHRGPHMIDKLDIKPSARSGAADDLAGLVFQLAASMWLRAKRTASWSTVCIDEALSATDKSNTRSVMGQLQRMLTGSFGFAQGFVCSHDQASIDAMPARIQIIGGDNGATIQVR